MKNLLLLLSLIAVVSCGSKNNNAVDSGSVKTGTSGLNTEVPVNLVNFEGNYDIVRQDSYDCGAAIRIERICNGYRLLSNNSRPEDFCNVNKGQMSVANDDTRNPPNPDRNPPNPDGGVIVTQEANQLRSIVKVSNMAFTNTLTLESNGILTKVSNFKSRVSRCVFLKR